MLDIIFAQVGRAGAAIPCDDCGEPLTRATAERDHINPVSPATGGADDPENERYVCEDCHKRKTFGNGATTAGSDINKIVKARKAAKRRAIEAGEIPAPCKARMPGRSFRQATQEEIAARRARNKLMYAARKAAHHREAKNDGHGKGK